ncbi:RNA 2',3'-cyclic phosphodiesterase [Nocardioides sp. SYSU DS0663]|uniref:RNA 2',3'-cyclic phosphodiesterase n=1 Tax=Nocardioides sp. SYSU DS0663 TaxID=3416445 RepID=UPI003F4BCDAD
MFAALVPPDHAVEDLEEFLEPRRDAGRSQGGFRWAGADQVHLTLAFYADVPVRALDDLVERLGRAAARRTPFEVRVTGGGAFPDVARARVLWAGLGLDEAGATELDRLATGCRSAAVKAGVAVDGQRFRPHLTVARLGRPAEVTRWVRLLDSYAGPAWTADRVALVESHLGQGPRGRPRYDVVEELPLG